MEQSKMKNDFNELISKRSSKHNSFKLSKEKYEAYVALVKEAKSGITKENKHYKVVKHYDVLTVNGVEKLIFPMKNDIVLYYVHEEQLFDILKETHEAIGHGGRDRMKHELHQYYKNITIQDIQTFLSLCQPCLQKRCREKKGLVVDLIDINSYPDEPWPKRRKVDKVTKITRNVKKGTELMNAISTLNSSKSCTKMDNSSKVYVLAAFMQVQYDKLSEDLRSNFDMEVVSLLRTYSQKMKLQDINL